MYGGEHTSQAASVGSVRQGRTDPARSGLRSPLVGKGFAFFDKLKDVKTGDTVTVYTKYGEFQYKVTELISFNKTDKKYVSSTDEARLTLYTCKKDILGASGERIGVICEPVSQKFYVQAEEEKN